MNTALKALLISVFALFLVAVINYLYSRVGELQIPPILGGLLCKFCILKGINLYLNILIIGWILKQWIAYFRS